MTVSDQLRAITIPDIDPSDLPQGTNFSMVAGNFLEVYTTKGRSLLLKGQMIGNFLI